MRAMSFIFSVHILGVIDPAHHTAADRRYRFRHWWNKEIAVKPVLTKRILIWVGFRLKREKHDDWIFWSLTVFIVFEASAQCEKQVNLSFTDSYIFINPITYGENETGSFCAFNLKGDNRASGQWTRWDDYCEEDELIWLP